VKILQCHALRSSCHSRPYRTQLNCHLNSLLFITPRWRPHRKHCVSNSKSTVPSVFVSAGTCLPSPCSETAVCLFAYFIATAVLVVCFEVYA
jgi:hypothetical protein